MGKADIVQVSIDFQGRGDVCVYDVSTISMVDARAPNALNRSQFTYHAVNFYSKHGCDYKGYGFACKLPRLDLTGFANEAIHDRDRPVLQLFCSVCHHQESWEGNVLVRCEGCPKAVHQQCAEPHHQLSDAFVAGDEPWFCDPACQENARRKRIVVELPRKRLPLMCAPKNNSSSNSSNASSPSSSPMLHRRISSSSSSSS